MATITELREQLEMHQELLVATNEFLTHDPNDEETLQSKYDTESDIARIKAEIAQLTSKSNASASVLPPPPPPPAPATARHAPPPPPPPSATAQAVASFSVGDHVQAKWSEDQSFYPAIVVSKTGNPNDPLYTVKFTGYGNTETTRHTDIKATDSSKKRKADEAVTGPAPSRAIPPPPPSPLPSASNSSNVISAAPSVDPTLAKKRVPSMVSDGPTRLPREPKKLKSNKALDTAKNNWQAWQKSGPKVSGAVSAPKQKESQFRVGTLPGAKVGFTGSGKGMQKDAARAVWKFSNADD